MKSNKELKKIHDSGTIPSASMSETWLRDVMYKVDKTTYLISTKICNGSDSSSGTSLSFLTKKGYKTIYSCNPILEFKLSKEKDSVIESIEKMVLIFNKFINS